MGKTPFMRPVLLRSEETKSGTYKINNVSDALKYLRDFWSGPRTREYQRAKAISLSALDNLVSAESARGYLIAAAERAGLIYRSRVADSSGSETRA